MTDKIETKIKGHESFYIREGWLKKGVSAIESDQYILGDIKKAVDELGVGANMAKSIRYWLQAVGLTEESKSGKRYQKLTEGFGTVIYKNDPFIEDIGSLFLLHYKLVTNSNYATSWYLFFNKIAANEIARALLPDILKQEVRNRDNSIESISEKSIHDDCNCIIKTYYMEENDMKNPEDNMVCPFAELGLIKRVNIKHKGDLIIKTIPSKNILDRLIVLYVIVDNLDDNKSTTIKSLIEDECNVGKVFNLDKNAVNSYIDILENEELITVNRTAGLNTVSSELSLIDVLNRYYEEL